MPTAQARGEVSCAARPALSARPSAVPSAAAEGSRDHQPLNLVGALDDLKYLRLAHVAFCRKILDVAITAEHLDRVGGHPHGGVGREQLGHRRLRAERLPGVLAAGGGTVERAGRLHTGGHVGEEERQALEVDARLPELAALACVA